MPVLDAAHWRYRYRDWFASHQLIWQVRCSREIPICERCARLGSECSYPPESNSEDNNARGTKRPLSALTGIDTQPVAAGSPSSNTTWYRQTSSQTFPFSAVSSIFMSPIHGFDRQFLAPSIPVIVLTSGELLSFEWQKLLLTTWLKYTCNAGLIVHQPRLDLTIRSSSDWNY